MMANSVVDPSSVIRWFSALGLVKKSELLASPVRLHNELRTGILLCRALNAIQPGLVPTINANGTDNKRAALDNLQAFVSGCQRLLKEDVLYHAEFKCETFYSHAEGLHDLLAVLHRLMELHYSLIRAATATAIAAPTIAEPPGSGSCADSAATTNPSEGETAAGLALRAVLGTSGRRAVALYPYAASRSDELTFHEGAIIQLVTTPNEGWWEGILGVCGGVSAHSEEQQ